MDTKQACLSILMLPWLSHGHIYPYLQLAKRLSTKNFTISLCSTSVNLTLIKEALETSPSVVPIHLLELDVPSLPELPPEFHTTKNIPPCLMPQLFHAFRKSSSSFFAIITSLKPDILIYDIFQSWAPTFASSLGIPAVHFATFGTAAYSFYYHHLRNKNLPFPYDEIYLRGHELKALQTPVRAGTGGRNHPDDEFSHFNDSSEVILMNTSRGIEGKYIDFLSAYGNKKVVAVGPLVTPPTMKSFNEKHSHIMQWLSKKAQFSTLFISFGSENYLSKDEMEAVAKGLEKSNVDFIWAMRFPPNNKVSLQEALGMEFVDRMRKRGLIVEGWAPQTEILAHRSIGGFMSHCGMNSVVESIYFGVPMIGVPLKLDQPLNARLVVEAGVSLEVIRDENGCISCEDVANTINKLFVEKTGEDMRLKAAELSKKMIREEEEEEEYGITEAAEQLRRLCMECKMRIS